MEKIRVLQELKNEEKEGRNDEGTKNEEEKKEDNVDDETEETTFFTAFCNDMEDLFKKV